MTTIVGLTGGIACGKSTVARGFVRRGAQLVDADVIAREVVAPGTPGLAAIVAAFGAAMLRPDGSLDRGKLGALVFQDSAALARLNELLHPAIGAEIRARVEAAKGAQVEVVVVDAALLIELGLAALCDFVVVVHAPRSVQTDRLMARNGLDAAAAAARIDSQVSHAERLHSADYPIDNGGSERQLESHIEEVWRAIIAAAARAQA